MQHWFYKILHIIYAEMNLKYCLLNDVCLSVMIEIWTNFQGRPNYEYHYMANEYSYTCLSQNTHKITQRHIIPYRLYYNNMRACMHTCVHNIFWPLYPLLLLFSPSSSPSPSLSLSYRIMLYFGSFHSFPNVTAASSLSSSSRAREDRLSVLICCLGNHLP